MKINRIGAIVSHIAHTKTQKENPGANSYVLQTNSLDSFKGQKEDEYSKMRIKKMLGLVGFIVAAAGIFYLAQSGKISEFIKAMQKRLGENIAEIKPTKHLSENITDIKPIKHLSEFNDDFVTVGTD